MKLIAVFAMAPLLLKLLVIPNVSDGFTGLISVLI
jgi:uncharacterized membrane protein